MVERICKLPKQNSFFLFGARGTGKTTILKENYRINSATPENVLLIDLLDPDQEEIYTSNPNRLKEMLVANPKKYKTVILDEIQKAPALLDVIHYCIEQYKHIQFIMTGSSARKLKHGGANLLGGRAFSIHLYPFTFLELPDDLSILDILACGTLPKIFEYEDTVDKSRFLKTYTQTYLKQEVQLEQLVRDIVSFREFLELAGQSNGEILNYSNISNQSGVDEKTIARYFEILVDTLIGFFLEPFNESVRVRQSQKPKFYLFDTGIQRHLTQMSGSPLRAGSSEYGKLFEQWIVCECFRLNEYFEKNFRFYFLRTKDNVEIDLIIQKPGKKRIAVEIKSSSSVEEKDCKNLLSLAVDIPNCKELWIISNEKVSRKLENGVTVYPWKEALRKLFIDS